MKNIIRRDWSLSIIANEYQKKLEEKKEKWLAAIKEDQIGAFTHILNTADNDIVKVYNIQAFPTKILVSPTGEILGRWEGEAPELDRMLEKYFLNEPGHEADGENFGRIPGYGFDGAGTVPNGCRGNTGFRKVAEDEPCGGGSESHDIGRKGVYGDRQ